jgi:CheY-like chemotaxis protein
MSLASKQLETIGQLAAGIAHDFNNSLAVIIASAELLKEEPHETLCASELVEDILTSSQRAARLTSQLLAYSRKAQMVLEPTDIHQLIDNTVALLRRSIDPCVQVGTRLNAENANVLADTSLLDSALLNLLVNARDAMPKGGQLTIATSSFEVAGKSPKLAHGLSPGNYVLIEVLDTGEGIPLEVLPNIFDPFFTTKPIGKGTGLGLAAVAGTIKSLKGSIEVESELGCGTAFRILLPCVANTDSAVKQGVTQLKSGSGRVLLVDDDALVRRAAAATLQSLGYDVTIATDGIHALEVFKAATVPFKLAILDLRMPRMDGEATFDALHRLAPNLAILIWSGFGGDLDVETLLRKGAVGFIQKPYRIVEFSHAVYEAVNGQASSQALAAT